MAEQEPAPLLFNDSSDESIHFPDEDVAVAESEREFEDLFGYRRKSVRRILEETFDAEMKAASLVNPEYIPRQSAAQPVPQVTVRYRTPTFLAPNHDVFGDVIHNFFQKLMAKGQPADLCHWMAYVFAMELDKKEHQKWQRAQFMPDVYVTEDTEEAMKKFSDMWKAADWVLVRNGEECDLLNEKWTGIHVAADSMRGLRHKQEDRFVAYPNAKYMNRGDDPTALLGVFDGHGGHECSQYAAGHFWEEWLKNKTEESLESWLTSSLKALDVRMTVRSEKEQWKGGTTAVCAAIDLEKRMMAFAWLGDSPGYVMNNMEFRKITRDHSPSDPEEARRVEEDGGQLFVIGGELRVNGVLNLTRALGDVQGRPMISNEPESASLAIERNDYLVLLACDGISDVLDEKSLYETVEQFVNAHPVQEYHKMARFICQTAYNKESADNLTVSIGFLRPPIDVWNLFKSSNDSDEDED